MPGEALDNTCFVDEICKKRGWMFWGCFSGQIKGPCVFWEKEWKSINKERCCERLVPVVQTFMQDGAPGHSARSTITELHERGIYPMFWPAFSPDLDPIEAI
jgi:hypothetical protein